MQLENPSQITHVNQTDMTQNLSAIGMLTRQQSHEDTTMLKSQHTVNESMQSPTQLPKKVHPYMIN